MRTYVYNGSWAEFQNGGPGDPPVKTRNVMSGIGWAVIPVPSYEGSALATWKSKQYSKIRIRDNTETDIEWEGYVDRVLPTRTGVTLMCLEPQAMLRKIFAKSWADFELDEGIISSIEGVGNTELHDVSQDFTTDEWNTPHSRGILLTGLAPRFFLQRSDQTALTGNFSGPPAGMVQDEPDLSTIVQRTEGSEDIDYWRFMGDPADLATIKIDYQMEIDWAGSDPGAALQIYNFNTPGWENIVASFSKATIERATYTLSSNLNYYINSDDEVHIRRYTAGTGLDYTWSVYQCKVYGTWSNEYDGTQFTVTDTVADDTLIASGDLDAAYVHVGDKYHVGERLDVMLAAIFSNETTGFTSTDIDTSTNYMYRNFENAPCLEIVRAGQDVDRADYWNDVSVGSTFKYATSYDASGFEVNETNIDPDGIEGEYAAENIIEKITIFGDPETGIQSTYTAGTYTAGDPERTLWQRFKKTFTELYQMAKGIVDARAGTAPFVGRLRFTTDLAGLRSLTVGQTIDIKIDMNAAGGDEIDETNSLVQVIEREQSANSGLKTMLEVGPAPMHVNAPQGKPSDIPTHDRGFELGRSTWEDYDQTKARIQAGLGSQSPSGIPGGERKTPISFDSTYSDVKIQWDQADKLIADADSVDLGTSVTDEDIYGYGDLDFGTTSTSQMHLPKITIDGGNIDADNDDTISITPGGVGDMTTTADFKGSGDGDFDDDIVVGSSAYTIQDDGSNRMVINLYEYLRIISSFNDSPTIQFYQDANNFLIMGWSDSSNCAYYNSILGGSAGTHVFNGNIILAAGKDVNPATGNTGSVGTPTYYWEEIYCKDLHYSTYDDSGPPWDHFDDLAVIAEMVGADGLERMPPVVKDDTGKFVSAEKKDKLVFGAIRQLTRRIQELEEKLQKEVEKE